MNLQKQLIPSIILCLISTMTQAEHFPNGSDVLANCHSFFSKGKIKRPHKEHYVINFYKASRPVLCTPFAWDSMFLVPYQPVSEFTGKIKSNSGFFSVYVDEVFKTGDQLKIDFEASSRGAMFSKKYSVVTEIIEINANGAAQLKTVDGETEAQRAFQRWVGTNYVSLDFSTTLKADRLTILDVEKK